MVACLLRELVGVVVGGVRVALVAQCHWAVRSCLVALPTLAPTIARRR